MFYILELKRRFLLYKTKEKYSIQYLFRIKHNALGFCEAA